ncbi:MAG TPA: flagellar biosynthetic protein FliO [Thermodesulfovibrionales bacterium]|nr:flagellar biosynthetic protein FliO [Thermodesulfovibrionales bacterium]
MISAYVQMILALAAVIGLILLSSMFMKKRQARTGTVMSVVSYQSFGPRKGVAALKMGKEVLLLGVTSGDVKLLKTFKEDDFEPQATAEMNAKIKMLKDMKERLHEHK